MKVTFGLKDLTAEQAAKTIIAYEPRWAIFGSGKGQPATAQDAQEMASVIRKRIAELYSDDVAQKIRILYGGSADKKNAGDYLSQKDVDGLLVGGKSTSLAEFMPIVEKAAEIGPTEGRIPYIGGNWKTYEIKDSVADFARFFNNLDATRVEVGVAPQATQISELRDKLQS